MHTPRTATEVTANQLEVLANTFEENAIRLREVAAVASSQDSKSLAMYNWASVAKGLELLGGFVAKAEESKRRAELGNPILPGELKPRSTARKKTVEKKNAESESAKMGEVLKARRKRK